MEFLLYIVAIAIVFLAFGVAAKVCMNPDDADGIVPACFITAAFLLYVCVIVLGVATVPTALARDDGRYAGSPLHDWFEGLRSGKGPCCSDADGTAVSDPDWSMEGNRYRVRLMGRWFDVPDEAVITEPNRAGKTMVWPVWRYDGGEVAGLLMIRCFMPGPET